MKRNRIYLSALVLIFATLSGCIINNTNTYPPPKSCFTTQYTEYYTNETISFINCSEDSESYEWSFGDGTVSYERHPSHRYSQKGVYTVRLIAIGMNTEIEYTAQITILGSTDLDIKVMFYGTDTPFANCEVTLYGNQTDWENFTNPIISGNTDADGIVIFIGLDPVVYFIDAYKKVNETEYYGNDNLGNTTDPLVEFEVNAYNIYVELLTKPKDKRNRNSYIIKKMVKVKRENRTQRKIHEENFFEKK